jgi:hypothetical protein
LIPKTVEEDRHGTIAMISSLVNRRLVRAETERLDRRPKLARLSKENVTDLTRLRGVAPAYVKSGNFKEHKSYKG